MKTRRAIQLFFILSALILSSVFLFYRIINNYISTISASADLQIHFLDVGQGDASLIRTPDGKNILIDGGPGENILEPLSRVLPWYEQTIDLMILTHPHDDHVAGLIPILQRYQINKILYTGVAHTAPAYLEWLNIIKNKKISLSIIDRPQIINLEEDLRLEIIYPVEDLSGESVANLNNSSIVARLVYWDNSFLFMGDMEIEVEEELIALKKDLNSDLIKVGHHGSNTSSSQNFINLVRPKIAIISLGEDNKFGHPSLRVINRYERAGAQVYRTDIDSTISFKSDGYSIVNF